MPTVCLPENPDLDALRTQARRLQRAARAADPEALRLVADHHPEALPGASGLPLSVAQLVVARRYGFASWPRLRRYLDAVREYRWDPTPPVHGESPAARFCRLACLNYDHDGPAHRDAARAMLVPDPDLPTRDLWCAATAARADVVADLLRADPSAARRRGGAYGWSPLFHLAYSRLHEPASDGHGSDPDAVLRTARALLAAGADPHEGYLWRGLATPFTLLTGVFGEGEQGPVAQPRHPDSVALGALLLDAGTDPNDGQTLYNRMFGSDDDHLELLLGRGLGRGDGGPWRRRLGDAAATPVDLVRAQLRWALEHDQRDRVDLLLAHGADAATPFDDGRTPVAVAALQGHTELVSTLGYAGAPPPELDPSEEFVAAVMRGDEAAARASTAGERVRGTRPGLIVWAAGRGRVEAVRLLLDLGFDTDALGRADVPVEGDWETALHAAVTADSPEVAALLLERGADAGIRDTRFDATAAGWAGYLGRPRVAALLPADPG